MTASSAVAIAEGAADAVARREALRMALAGVRAAQTAFNEAQAPMAVPQSVIAQVDQAELRTACLPTRNSGTAGGIPAERRSCAPKRCFRRASLAEFGFWGGAPSTALSYLPHCCN